MSRFYHAFSYAIFALVSLAAVSTTRANLVTNGGFDSVTYTATDATHPLTTLYGEFGTGTGSHLTVGSWSTAGYNFVYAPGTGDAGTQANGANAGVAKQAPGQYNGADGYGNTYLFGNNNGSANGLPATSPSGGNFIAADGDTTYRGAITQSISGLTVGKTYQVSFYWGAAQQEGAQFTSATTNSWSVSLINTTDGTKTQTFTTSTVNVPNKGFSGWMLQTFNYTATATTETLSFLAGGAPNGQPPFALLDGVSLDVVPEFSHWAVFATFGLLVAAGSRRGRILHWLNLKRT